MPFARTLITALLCLAPLYGAMAKDPDELDDQSVAADVGESACERKIRLLGLPAKTPSLSIWSYFGRTFDSASYSEYMRVGDRGYSSHIRGVASIGGGFKPSMSTFRNGLKNRPWMIVNPSAREMESGSQGETLLDRNQFFSLKVMEDTDYIGKRLREAQAEIPKKISPDQVTFIEATTARTGAELFDHFGEIPPIARQEARHRSITDFLDQFERDGEEPSLTERQKRMPFQLKEGTIWIISGQPNGKPAKLFLDGSTIKIPIDRNKYKFVWEFGRAAQITNRAFYETLKAGIYLISRELILMEGNLEDAYIFGHSLNERIGKIYRRVRRMADYSGYTHSERELAHVSRLADTLGFIPIDGINPYVGDLVRASQNQLSAYEALRLFLITQQNLTEFLSRPDENDGTVEIRDFSSLAAHLNAEEGKKHPSLANEAGQEALIALIYNRPICEFRDTLPDYAVETSKQYSVPVTGRIVKERSIYTQRMEDVLQDLDKYLVEFNAIEVTSDGDLTGDQLLVIAYRRQLEKLRAIGETNPKQKLIDLGVNFALFSQHAGIPSNGPRWNIYRPKIETLVNTLWFTNYMETLVKRIDRDATIYSAAAVAALAERTLDATIDGFGRGEAHRKHYLMNPELLGF